MIQFDHVSLNLSVFVVSYFSQYFLSFFLPVPYLSLDVSFSLLSPVFFYVSIFCPSCLQSSSICLFVLLSPVFFYMSVCLLFRLLHLSFLSSSFILPVYSLVNAIYSTLLYNSLTLICTGTTWPYPVRLSPISVPFTPPYWTIL